MELLTTIMIELTRLGVDPLIFPRPEDQPVYLRQAWDKVLAIKRACQLWKDYWLAQGQTWEYLELRDAAASRPTHITGLAPWSHYLMNGAPGIARAEGDPLGRPGADMVQVIPPAGQELIDEWVEEELEAMRALGMEVAEDSEEDDRGDEVLDELDMTADPNYDTELDIEREWVQRRSVVPLPELNDTLSECIPGAGYMGPS